MKNIYGIEAGDISRLLHHFPGGWEIPRRIIVWDPSIDGDDTVWLVTWATTEDHGEPGKPSSGPFKIKVTTKLEGENWNDLDTWKSLDHRVRAHGRLYLDDEWRKRMVVGRYVPSDPEYNSVEIMAASYHRHLDRSEKDVRQTLQTLGGQRKAWQREAAREMERIAEAVKRAAAEGVPETTIASLASLDRMTVRKILGK